MDGCKRTSVIAVEMYACEGTPRVTPSVEKRRGGLEMCKKTNDEKEGFTVVSKHKLDEGKNMFRELVNLEHSLFFQHQFSYYYY